MVFLFSSHVSLLLIILKINAIDSIVKERYPNKAEEIKINTLNTNSSWKQHNKTPIFSGYYSPDYKSTERYAGAWLVTKQTFMNPIYINRLHHIPNLEAVSLALMKVGIPLMTRDYFDFQVIHLSSTTNQIPLIANEALQQSLTKRMESTVNLYRMLSTNFSSTELLDHRLRNKAKKQKRLANTLVVIPYTSVPASQILHSKDDKVARFTYQLRLLYLEACVLSISRYFPRIVITTSNQKDLEDVKGLDLPIWKYLDLSNRFQDIPCTFLPRESLLHVYHIFNHSFNSNSNSNSQKKEYVEWRDIQYLYYTEMDQILHMRSLSITLDVLDRLHGSAIMIPHRINTIAHPKVFSEVNVWKHHADIHKNEGSWNHIKLEELSRSKVIIENPYRSRGSCCDDGRYLFQDCGNWWVNCPNYGLQNYTEWLQFGKHTYTMPTGSAHRAKCKYYQRKVICPRPNGCHEDMSIPQSQNVCREIPNVITIPNVKNQMGDAVQFR